MGLFGNVGKFLFGSGDKTKKLPTMTPEQQKVLNQMLSMLNPQGQLGQGYGESLDYLREMLNPSEESFAKFADPYMKQFEQQTVPGLAERFAGMGGGMGGGLSSSGFGQSLSAAGGNLQSTLAQLKAQLAGQAAQGLMGQYSGMLGQGLGAKPFGYQHIQGSSGLIPNFLNSYAQSAGEFMGGGSGGGGGLSSIAAFLGL